MISQFKIDRLIDAKRIGSSNADACAFASIHERTFYLWLKRGKAAKKGKYFEFVERLKKAESQAVVASLATIQQAAKKGTWQAAAWFLERTRPHQYSLRPERFEAEALKMREQNTPVTDAEFERLDVDAQIDTLQRELLK